MQSDELFPSEPPTSWPLLENRINRLLEAIVQLRNANASLMKENVILQNQLKDKETEAPALPSQPVSAGPSPEETRLRHQYDEALEDLKKVKTNLQRLENLAREFHLEDSDALVEEKE